jgi:hypothetical protein
MKKWFFRIGIISVIVVIAISLWLMYNWRDRHPDYSIDIKIKNSKAPQTLTAGFAKRIITPTVIDTWNDVNGDAKYSEDDGDTYNDNNSNGEFDAVWIAGFSNGKPAQGVHDDVWARVMVLDDGESRIALVSLDAIGLMHDDVVDIREQIPSDLNIDYTFIASTHTHESNDLMGIWGENEFNSGVDPELMIFLKTQTVAAIKGAVKNMRPSNLIFAEDLSGEDAKFIKDTRNPIVKASGIHLMQVIDSESDTTLGTIINWANHPESLWSKNLLISSDFPHYIREGIEKGIFNGRDLVHKGLGGIAIYFSGALGGLMAPHPSLPIPDPFLDTLYSNPSFAKTKALGEQVAILSLSTLKDVGETIDRSNISLRAKTIFLPLDNTMFRIAGGVGLLNRGTPKLFTTRSEVAALKIGPAMFVSIPGEIYPEIIYGGIEAPAGQEFDLAPIEVPPIQELIKEKYKFYLGLSNDEIGYIIPKSEWDIEKPYLYNSERDTYGEENSLGPETGPLLYKAIMEVINDLE